MMKEFLLGIDIGSGGCKATLLNVCSKKIITLSREYPTYYPKAGWAEQDCEDWIKNAGQLIKLLLDRSDCLPEQIRAVGIGGVTHSPVLLDENRNVLGPVIHLTDARSFEQAEWLRKKAGSIILKTGLNPVDVMWTISMLLWIRENDFDRWSRISKILFPKDYVRFRLTGSEVTDEVDAQGTLLFNPLKKRWQSDLLKLIELNRDVLPEVASPVDVVGKVTSEGSEWSGLKPETPVIAGTTDTLLEVYASGSIKPGDCTVKLATFGRICVITDKPCYGKGLVNYSYIKEGLWYPGTGTRSFATSLRWFRDEFCKDIANLKDAYSIMDGEAEDIPPGAGGLLYHPYLQGEGSPYNDPHLRGDFIGLSLHHKRSHLIRAILEGTAFSLLDCVNFIKSKGIKINMPLKFIGGGTNSKLWTEIVADVLGSGAVVPAATDPSIGAALLAGVGTGVYKSIEDAQKVNSGFSRKIRHDKEKTEAYNNLFNIYKKVQNLLVDVNHNLSESLSNRTHKRDN